MLKKKTSGAYSSVTAVKKKVSGAWSNASTVYKKASGAWSVAWRQPWIISVTEGTGSVGSSAYIYATGSNANSEFKATGFTFNSGDVIDVDLEATAGHNDATVYCYLRGDSNQSVLFAYLYNKGEISRAVVTKTVTFSGSGTAPLFHAYVTHQDSVTSSVRSDLLIYSIKVNGYQVFPQQ